MNCTCVTSRLTRVWSSLLTSSPDVQVDDPLIDPLGNAARAANRIYLHGHTDAYVASQIGTQLAIRRAVEVRRLLISLNVEPSRFASFIAEPAISSPTTARRKEALNRRVEIELRKW